jgi:hypothetical protein
MKKAGAISTVVTVILLAVAIMAEAQQPERQIARSSRTFAPVGFRADRLH